jgi:hypothetical protein
MQKSSATEQERVLESDLSAEIIIKEQKEQNSLETNLNSE